MCCWDYVQQLLQQLLLEVECFFYNMWTLKACRVWRDAPNGSKMQQQKVQEMVFDMNGCPIKAFPCHSFGLGEQSRLHHLCVLRKADVTSFFRENYCQVNVVC